jgi:UDPglucose 6-dehydrogenase
MGEVSKKPALISIIGCGVVGLNVGKGLSELGNVVTFYDTNNRKAGELISLDLSVSYDAQDAVLNSEISFVCVPTPTSHNKVDLSYIKSAVNEIGKALAKKSDYHVVVIKSTVLPTTTEKIVIPILEKRSGKKAGKDIGVCSNPEFLTEIHHSWTDDSSFVRSFRNERFIVIGEFDQKSGDRLHTIYETLKIPVFRTNLRTAEMVKYAFNCALACRISYWNEIFYICQKMRMESNIVASIAAMDERIGKYGTIHGKAFGGKCLPKDLKAFIDFSKKLGYMPRLLEAVQQVNFKIAAESGIRE